MIKLLMIDFAATSIALTRILTLTLKPVCHHTFPGFSGQSIHFIFSQKFLSCLTNLKIENRFIYSSRRKASFHPELNSIRITPALLKSASQNGRRQNENGERTKVSFRLAT